jgi:hypothetical protein
MTADISKLWFLGLLAGLSLDSCAVGVSYLLLGSLAGAHGESLSYRDLD